MSEEIVGVGSEIAKLIPDWAVQFKDGCDCKNFQLAMDERGPQWCEDNFEYLVDHFMKQGDRLIPILKKMPSFAKRVAVIHALTRAINKVKKHEET